MVLMLVYLGAVRRLQFLPYELLKRLPGLRQPLRRREGKGRRAGGRHNRTAQTGQKFIFSLLWKLETNILVEALRLLPTQLGVSSLCLAGSTLHKRPPKDNCQSQRLGD